MSNFKRYLKMLKTGEFFWKIKQKLSVLFIKNKIIKNDILEDKEYRRLKKKYYRVIKNRVATNEMESSNKVWIFWYQGLDEAPILIKKCIESIKKVFEDKEVIILTKNNFEKYVQFPDYIINKFNKGIITFTHFSDLIRIELLAKYGGIWCDATLYFTDKIPNYVEKSDLFVFKNIDLDRCDKSPIVASSWFMCAKKNNDIIIATRDLLYEYHKCEKVLKNYFLIHLFFTMATQKFSEEWKNVPTFSNVNPHLLQFELLDTFNKERFEQIKSLSFVHKLNKVIINDTKNNNTFYNYICK